MDYYYATTSVNSSSSNNLALQGPQPVLPESVLVSGCHGEVVQQVDGRCSGLVCELQGLVVEISAAFKSPFYRVA